MELHDPPVQEIIELTRCFLTRSYFGLGAAKGKVNGTGTIVSAALFGVPAGATRCWSTVGSHEGLCFHRLYVELPLDRGGMRCADNVVRKV